MLSSDFTAALWPPWLHASRVTWYEKLVHSEKSSFRFTWRTSIKRLFLKERLQKQRFYFKDHLCRTFPHLNWPLKIFLITLLFANFCFSHWSLKSMRGLSAKKNLNLLSHLRIFLEPWRRWASLMPFDAPCTTTTTTNVVSASVVYLSVGQLFI